VHESLSSQGARRARWDMVAGAVCRITHLALATNRDTSAWLHIPPHQSRLQHHRSRTMLYSRRTTGVAAAPRFFLIMIIFVAREHEKPPPLAGLKRGNPNFNCFANCASELVPAPHVVVYESELRVPLRPTYEFQKFVRRRISNTRKKVCAA